MGATADRADVLLRAVTASVVGDSSVVKDLFTNDIEGRSPTLNVSSAAALAVELEDLAGAFSDPELEVRSLDVTENRAYVEWTAEVTHSGAIAVGPDLVIEPTGTRCRLHGVTIAEFDGDRICSFRQYWDEAEALTQLGLLAET